jgi:hypothetical protein
METVFSDASRTMKLWVGIVGCSFLSGNIHLQCDILVIQLSSLFCVNQFAFPFFPGIRYTLCIGKTAFGYSMPYQLKEMRVVHIGSSFYGKNNT